MELNHTPFNQENFRELDRDLSERERQEWDTIYAAFRAGSVLTGKAIGADSQTITVEGAEKTVHYLVIIPYRVKIIIPENEVWYSPAETHPPYVLKSMAGAEIPYIITDVDREGCCCVASRRLAGEALRRRFLKSQPQTGSLLDCHAVLVGARRVMLDTNGFDVTLSQRDVSYGIIPDLRETFRPGDACRAILKAYHAETGELEISIKEAEPHPFDGSEFRHPLNSRRVSEITGKYAGGVFCRLEEGLDCLCSYAQNQYDEDFRIGDSVMIVITRHDFERKRVYGKVISKW